MKYLSDHKIFESFRIRNADKKSQNKSVKLLSSHNMIFLVLLQNLKANRVVTAECAAKLTVAYLIQLLDVFL